jgi:hypothetical protein
MLEDIAQRLPMADRKLAFAVQGQSHAPMFDKKLTTAAWKNAARRMGAVITTLPTCHMVILEEPAKVAAVIDEAARTASKQQDELLTSQ